MNRVKLSFLPITLAIFLCACSANSEVPDQTSFVEEIEKVNTDFTDNVSALAKKTTEVTGAFNASIQETVTTEVVALNESVGKVSVNFGEEFEIEEGITYIFDEEHKIRVEYLKYLPYVDQNGNPTTRDRHYLLKIKTRYGDEISNSRYNCVPANDTYKMEEGRNPYKIKFVEINEDGIYVTAKIVVEE